MRGQAYVEAPLGASTGQPSPPVFETIRPGHSTLHNGFNPVYLAPLPGVRSWRNW